jgi:hypothetical protein
MKSRILWTLGFFAMVLLTASQTWATNWEFSMRVSRNNQPVALQVCLYEANNLNVPIRIGTSASTYGNGVNFRCDVKDPSDSGEPNTDNAEWTYIKPGSYVLRVDNMKASLTIYPKSPGENADFEITNDESGFHEYNGTRYDLGATESWTSVQTADVTIDQKLSSNVTAGTI